MRFQMIDKIASWSPGREAEGLKNVSATDEVFRDHFPRRAVLPGVLMLEGMQQLATALLEESGAPQAGRVKATLRLVEELKFRDVVGPGDTLRYRVRVLSAGDSEAVVAAAATKEGETVASCRMVFGLRRGGEADGPGERAAWLKALGVVRVPEGPPTGDISGVCGG